MTETLYAFLAIALVTLLSFNQRRSTLATYQNIIHSEFEIMANGVALQQMEILSGKDFETLLGFEGEVKSTTFTAGTIAIPFDVQTNARYVTAGGELSSGPSNYIEMTVSVMQDRYDNPLVTHTRILTS